MAKLGQRLKEKAEARFKLRKPIGPKKKRDKNKNVQNLPRKVSKEEKLKNRMRTGVEVYPDEIKEIKTPEPETTLTAPEEKVEVVLPKKKSMGRPKKK